MSETKPSMEECFLAARHRISSVPSTFSMALMASSKTAMTLPACFSMASLTRSSSTGTPLSSRNSRCSGGLLRNSLHDTAKVALNGSGGGVGGGGDLHEHISRRRNTEKILKKLSCPDHKLSLTHIISLSLSKKKKVCAHSNARIHMHNFHTHTLELFGILRVSEYVFLFLSLPFLCEYLFLLDFYNFELNQA